MTTRDEAKVKDPLCAVMCVELQVPWAKKNPPQLWREGAVIWSRLSMLQNSDMIETTDLVIFSIPTINFF